MRFKAAFFSALFVAFANAQVPNYVPTNGMLAWWPFNGNANDVSGNGNNGISNNAVLTVDRFGDPNSAYNFNGIDQLITGNIDAISNTSETTVTAWMRYTGNAGGQPYDTYFQFGTYGSHTLAYAWNYGALQFDLYSHCIQGTQYYPPSNINGSWHFVAVVDSETETRVYVDGTLLSLLPGGPTGNCYQGTSTFSIGSVNSATDNQWVTGDLDDIGFWNRALTQAEVEALYSAAVTLPCVSAEAVSLSGLNAGYQTTDAPSSLMGTPDGGLFFGPGVSGAIFDPAVAGPGSHTVVYTHVDADGCVNSIGLCTTVSLGIGINDPDNVGLSGVRVYPNPTEGVFTLELELHGLVSLTVHDGKGRQVLNQTFMAQGAKSTRIIDLSREAAGAYAMWLSTPEGSNRQQLVKH
ncbi:MAG: T9SS type A sorting domain-containing protein [Flavobacteriales bacterium]|nr:T9SS type A sorting domain-containing protein [Flavobacteriales bacterium]